MTQPWTALKLITPPTKDVLTLEMVKKHLRVEHSEEDNLIRMYMQAARNFVEGPYGFLGRALTLQTWELHVDGFPITPSEIEIPLPPLQSVTSIKYDDTAGNEQTLDPLTYYVDTSSEPGWVVPMVATPWPTALDGAATVRIRFVAGYASGNSPLDQEEAEAANVPYNIKMAMLLLIGNMYEHREQNVVGATVTSLPLGVDSLLRPHRIHLGMA